MVLPAHVHHYAPYAEQDEEQAPSGRSGGRTQGARGKELSCPPHLRATPHPPPPHPDNGFVSTTPNVDA